MIQAFLKGKSAILFNQNEDFKTSSSIGLLQYLPDDLFWSIMKDCCKGLSQIYFGEILSFHFWEHTDPTDTTNANFVEPDVWIETENYDVLIEAKVRDGAGQYRQQWQNEIHSLQNEQNNNGHKKPIILIALGGNENLKPDRVDNCPIYKTSWYFLLKSVSDERNRQKDNGFVSRILDDTLELFARQGLMVMEWLTTLPQYEILDYGNHLKFVTKKMSYWGFNNLVKIIINDKSIQQWFPIN